MCLCRGGGKGMNDFMLSGRKKRERESEGVWRSSIIHCASVAAAAAAAASQPPPPPPPPPSIGTEKQTELKMNNYYFCIPSSSRPFLIFASSRGAPPGAALLPALPLLPPQPPSSSLRISLLLALSSQAASRAQRVVQSLVSETIKYVNPRIGEVRNLEEALVTVPDLETIPYRVLRREKNYELRQIESYVVAETIMPGKRGFDFYESSQAFNILAGYLFGKNKKREEMEMTTPVVVSRSQVDAQKLEMTTPVISQLTKDQGQWRMAFVMPSKYGDDLPLPVDDAVKLRRIPPKTTVVAAFSGYVTDQEVKRQESKLRAALKTDGQVRPKELVQVEVAQFNPPFTPPFLRRNEVSLEVEWAKDL